MHGGYGYIDEFKVNRLYRAAKVLEIYEGSKEMEKIIISRTLLRQQEERIRRYIQKQEQSDNKIYQINLFK